MGKSRPFRAEDWWIGKASLLLGLVYLFSIRFSISFGDFWLGALCSLVTIIGFASLGYLINDYFDQEKDARVGKKNFLLGKSALFKIAAFALAFILLFSPWIFLPYDKVTVILITAQLLSYLIYSVPPIRIKERGAAGLITDALYAHAIPAVMAAYTYTLISNQLPDLVFIGMLFSWQFCVGIRNVLIHQLSDLHSDKESGTKTFVSKRSTAISDQTLPALKTLELLILCALIIVLAMGKNWFFVSLGAIVASGVACLFMDKNNGYRFYFPNILYDQWLPYSFIMILSISDWRFLLLLPLHAILFSGVILQEVNNRIPWGSMLEGIKSAVNWLSWKFRLMINWVIYIVFRLFMIDLIKEKTDAKGYILKKMNKQK
jgi:4-hydroxybenzoate polyprenyltransferase